MQKILLITQVVDHNCEIDRQIDEELKALPNTETTAILCPLFCVSSLTHSVEAASFVESSGNGIALVLGHQSVFPVNGHVDVFPHQSVGC